MTALSAGPEANPATAASYLAETQAAVVSGSCGENLIWTLDVSGTLKISGAGKMFDYSPEGEFICPWYDHRLPITFVVIEPGATSIGNWAFSYCGSLTSILCYIPN